MKHNKPLTPNQHQLQSLKKHKWLILTNIITSILNKNKQRETFNDHYKATKMNYTNEKN